VSDDRETRLTRLFDEHAAAVRRYVRRRHAGEDTDDLVSEVFVIAWRKIDDIPAEAELPWLYRTAWNVLANQYRKPLAVVVAEVPERADEVDVADRVIEDLALATAWTRLSGRDREVLRLAAWEGLDGPALAEALGIGVGGAAAALSRARQRLTDAYRAATTDDRAPGSGSGARTPQPAT
jgi:RNA polymerase sigma-70 factor (ECF subfamily)